MGKSATRMPATKTFFELASISFVNWYVFGSEDIPIDGIAAILGHNGAGKTSILDGMQVVLTGNSKNYLRLNALVQTDTRGGRRSVKDYVLGTIDDVEGASGGPMVLRDEAMSYVMLGFRHTLTGREVTAGICLSAIADVEVKEEDVEARFLVEGRILTAEDVALRGTNADGSRWTEALPWPIVETRLKDDPGLELHPTEKGPELFVKAMCRVIGPENGMIDHNKFLRNLKNTAMFKQVGNPTAFIRNFILDDHRVDISGMRASIARYRDIQQKVLEVEDRIIKAEGIEAVAREVTKRQRSAMRKYLLVSHGRHYLAYAAHADARLAVEANAAALAEAQAKHDGIGAELGGLEQRSNDLQFQLANGEAAVAIRDIESRLREADTRHSMAETPVQRARRFVREAAQIATLVEPYNAAAAQALEALKGRNATARVTADAIAALHGGSLAGDLEAAAKALGAQVSAAHRAVGEVSHEIETTKENIRRVNKGERELRGSTQDLMRLLEGHGIPSVPVCNLVTEVQEPWRWATEAVLGDHREALIVAPEDFMQAFEIYRASGLRNALVVNTTKTGETRRPKPGSLATVVTVDDGHSQAEHARAFVDYLLGAIIMVDGKEDFRREDNAVTVDLMRAAGRTMGKLPAPRRLILGVVHAEAVIAQLEAELEGLQTRHDAEERRLASLKTKDKALESLRSEFAALTAPTVAQQAAAYERVVAELVELKEDLERWRGSDDGGLRAEADKAKADLAAARRRLGEATQELGSLQGQAKLLGETLAKAGEAERQAKLKGLTLVEQAQEVLDGDDEVRRYVTLFSEAEIPFPNLSGFDDEDDDGESDPTLREPESDAELETKLNFLYFGKAEYDAKRANQGKVLFGSRLSEYVTKHGIALPEPLPDPERNYAAQTAWVRAELRELRSNTLVNYREKATLAYGEAVSNFRDKFVGEMGGAFDAIRSRLNELNRHLKTRDFHGLVYKFIHKERPSHRDIIELINAAKDPYFEMPLFGQALNAADVVARAVRRLEDLALDPEADATDLEDPRSFFDYDIAMLDAQGNEKTNLSQRVSTFSGGQAQVPYYVALASALAATYYPDQRSGDGGLALAIFDEAFNRMDAGVIQQVLDYMRDIGLQPLIAAPDKEAHTFIQLVDTMITLSRHGTTPILDVQLIRQHARDVFRAENPRLYGFDEFLRRHAPTDGTKEAASDGTGDADTPEDADRPDDGAKDGDGVFRVPPNLGARARLSPDTAE